MAINSFQDIILWQKAHKLTLGIYKATDKFPKSEIFGLTNQIRRASVSVASNIVEGYKRKTKNDSIRFYIIAEGSLEEVKYQLILAKDLNYISEDDYKSLFALSEEVGRLLYKWKNMQK